MGGPPFRPDTAAPGPSGAGVAGRHPDPDGPGGGRTPCPLTGVIRLDAPDPLPDVGERDNSQFMLATLAPLVQFNHDVDIETLGALRLPQLTKSDPSSTHDNARESVRTSI